MKKDELDPECFDEEADMDALAKSSVITEHLPIRRNGVKGNGHGNGHSVSRQVEITRETLTLTEVQSAKVKGYEGVPCPECKQFTMEALRAAFAERVAAIHAGTLPAADYKALGAKVEAEVATIVAECKLEPKADAVLHVIVAELLGAADVLLGKAPGTPAAGAHRAVTALNVYGRTFDHPQWQPLR